MCIIGKSLATLICTFAMMAAAQAQDWLTYRHDSQRTGAQPAASNLSNPDRVSNLTVKWGFPAPAGSDISASVFLDTQQHFVYRDKEGLVWDSFYENVSGHGHPQGWNFQQIPTVDSNKNQHFAASDIFVSVFLDTQQHFVYRDKEGLVWDSFYENVSGHGHPQGWNFQQINTSEHDTDKECGSSPPSAASDVFVSVFLNTQQHFSFRDNSGVIWDYFFENASGHGHSPGWHCQQITPGTGAFKSSPIVVDDTVFIGNTNGYFYALDAAAGKLKWQYPRVGDQALLGSCVGDSFAGGYGTYGIASSGTFAMIRGQRAVIFGAPDPTADGGLGSARLFALPLSADPNNPQPICGDPRHR
jgi:hypothetical protein